ncbi:MAG: hypothetical protein JWQ27_954 [Ferruginibacter sp.]|nr:hypothetical protein [Ferruginibacter sp.]
MKKMYSLIAFVCLAVSAEAQDSTSLLLTQISNDPATVYTTATFKTTRLINGHSSENLGKGVMDVKISHRFGKINGGGYELYGLDNASARLGVDYGISKNLMAGIGRSSFEKTFDAFVKYKILRQSTGAIHMPVSLSYVPTIAIKTQHFADPSRKNLSSSRFYYSHQIIIARKFSEKTSLQVMPGMVHQNLVPLASDNNNVFSLGVGGRRKLSKRLSLTGEYYYQITRVAGTTNSLSFGLDLETGGHVFQFHFTNSQGMTERNFIANTSGEWHKGDIYFGFNIARVFTVGKTGKNK